MHFRTVVLKRTCPLYEIYRRDDSDSSRPKPLKSLPKSSKPLKLEISSRHFHIVERWFWQIPLKSLSNLWKPLKWEISSRHCRWFVRIISPVNPVQWTCPPIGLGSPHTVEIFIGRFLTWIHPRGYELISNSRLQSWGQKKHQTLRGYNFSKT